MKKIRINELARELEVKPQKILDLLPELGVADKKTHSSSLDDDVAELIRRHFGVDGAGRHEVGQEDEAEHAGGAFASAAPSATEEETAEENQPAVPVAEASETSEAGGVAVAEPETATPAQAAPNAAEPAGRSRPAPIRPPLLGRGAPSPAAPGLPTIRPAAPAQPAAPRPTPAAPAARTAPPSPARPAAPAAGSAAPGTPRPGQILSTPRPAAPTGPRQPLPGSVLGPPGTAIPGAPRPAPAPPQRPAAAAPQQPRPPAETAPPPGAPAASRPIANRPPGPWFLRAPTWWPGFSSNSSLACPASPRRSLVRGCPPGLPVRPLDSRSIAVPFVRVSHWCVVPAAVLASARPAPASDADAPCIRPRAWSPRLRLQPSSSAAIRSGPVAHAPNAATRKKRRTCACLPGASRPLLRRSIAKSPFPRASPSKSFPKNWASRPTWSSSACSIRRFTPPSTRPSTSRWPRTWRASSALPRIRSATNRRALRRSRPRKFRRTCRNGRR